MSLLKRSINFAFGTSVSRVFGYLRDILMAYYLGSSFYADAFVIAQRFPNLFRRLFAEGAFAAAFVPLYVNQLKNTPEDAKKFVGKVLSNLIGGLVILCIMMIWLMPEILDILAPGFIEDPEKFSILVIITRLTTPYILFICLVSLLSSILNANHYFFVSGISPVVLNLCLIFTLTIFKYHNKELLVTYLSITITIAGFIQLSWLFYETKRRQLLPRSLIFTFDQDIKQLLKLILPIALGAGVTQINILVATAFASLTEGANSFIFYADRLIVLPASLIGTSISTVILPLLSINQGNKQQLIDTQLKSMVVGLVLSIPAAIGLIILAKTIIMILFERGEFNSQTTQATAKVLIIFALGLPSGILSKIISTSFYANQKGNIPLKAGIISVTVNIVLCFLLNAKYTYNGIAIASTIASWINTIVLLLAAWQEGILNIQRSLLKLLTKVTLSCLVMSIVTITLQQALHSWLEYKFFIIQSITLAIIIVFSSFSYLLTLQQFGLFKFNYLKSAIFCKPQ